MDSPYGQLNFGLNLDLDIEAKEETKANGTERIYNLKVAKRFEHIIFGIFILEVANGPLLWLFLYLLSISKTFSVKLKFLKWFYLTLSTSLIKRH